MTTAYSRIDRFLRQNLNDKDYPAYKEELDALCQAKAQRTWVGLTDEDKAILEAVHRELDRDCYEGNAPGHSHRTKGVWDEDNGKLAGKPCAWCLTWAKFTTLIKNEAAHGIKETP